MGTDIEVIEPQRETSLAVRDAEVAAMAQRFLTTPGLIGTDGKTQITDALARRVADLAILYELDPALGHLMLYEGKPYITAQGLASWAEVHPNYDGYEWRALSRAELESLGKAAMDVGVEVLIHRKDRRFPTKEYGFASTKNPYRGNVVERTFTLEMAHKRAFYRGIMRSCPPNLTRKRMIDPDLSLDEQRYQARLASVPTHSDRPQGTEWREFYARCSDAGVSHAEAHQAVIAAGFDLTWIDPETSEARDSMLAFEGTVHDALVIVGLEKPKAMSGAPKPVSQDSTAPAVQRRRREEIDQHNAEHQKQAEPESGGDPFDGASDEAEETEMTGSNAALVDTARAFDRFNDRLKAAPNDSNLKAIGAEIKLAVGRGELTGPDMLELRETATARLHDLKQRAAATAG